MSTDSGVFSMDSEHHFLPSLLEPIRNRNATFQLDQVFRTVQSPCLHDLGGASASHE